MTPYNYSVRINENRARAVGLLLPISTKQSIEICKFIGGKNVQKAIDMLNKVIDMKKPVPFNQFTNGAGHKHGIGPGKYPIKACKEILKLVKLVEANAQHKGLNTTGLEIIHICAKKGPKSWHYGRQSRIAMKRTHVEIVVEEKESKRKETKKEEVKEKSAKKNESKSVKKQEEKKEAKKEEKPIVKKTEKVETKEIKKPTEKVEKKHVKEEKPKLKKEIKKQDTKTEQSQEIKKPAEAKAENKVEEKKEGVKKEQPKEKVPPAAELAEKIKKKENKADKK